MSMGEGAGADMAVTNWTRLCVSKKVSSDSGEVRKSEKCSRFVIGAAVGDIVGGETKSGVMVAEFYLLLK